MTRDEVSTVLDYCPETGAFRWKVNISRKMRAGMVAGTNSHGYIRIKVGEKGYAAHRLAWLLQTGEWPTAQVDHINRIRNDNRFCNLRAASNAENHQNLPVLRTNKSGYTGVSWQVNNKKWQATIMVGRKAKYLGLFECPKKAHEAYLDAKAQLHTFNPTLRETA